jgi:hypothetical protein
MDFVGETLGPHGVQLKPRHVRLCQMLTCRQSDNTPAPENKCNPCDPLLEAPCTPTLLRRPTPVLTRRRVLLAAVVSSAVPLLAACTSATRPAPPPLLATVLPSSLGTVVPGGSRR